MIDVKLHLYVPDEWLCIDDADEWPCDGARRRLRGQITDRRELHQYMVKCWRQALQDLDVTDDVGQRELYVRFVAWTEAPR